ncbi:hypothetical protein COU78_01790 [Candidatus Peregrinibacteria bacterium CG10_big_fil_rev_8_21_14_0_10_49_24]|nr:MAG: hypothetical protein COU78_01790 [Candidatus Peregrinibacteria bacterium CG10_big_fil_rev_8_21_14_0_10_49_24]PJA67388.1 MAG: hypothetical protein CO157_05020 [Candidatus Peregrinibacteria bacterium CG_4_9_14_3_um_filter_49_12]
MYETLLQTLRPLRRRRDDGGSNGCNARVHRIDSRVTVREVQIGFGLGGAEGHWWEQKFDMLELAKKFTELHYSLENITLLLSSQVEEKEHLIL